MASVPVKTAGSARPSGPSVRLAKSGGNNSVLFSSPPLFAEAQWLLAGWVCVLTKPGGQAGTQSNALFALPPQAELNYCLVNSKPHDCPIA